MNGSGAGSRAVPVGCAGGRFDSSCPYLKEERVPVFEVQDRKYDVDEDGFLQDPAIWNQAVAADFATTEGVTELTENHWKVINYLRNYYLQFGMAPMIRKLCKETGFTLSQIYEMFPSGPAKGACKLAGLPKPTGCV